MWKKKEEKKEEKEESLLKELCGDDAKLCDFLSYYMYLNPLEAISKKDLDILVEEAEKSGNFRPAVDKAIFEAAQNLGERERYIKVIENLAWKSIHATEQEKEKAEKEGLTDHAASLGRRIENQKFMSERAEDIINVASKFYNEKLVELGESVTRERREAEQEERRTEDLEKAGRETRKTERKEMGRKEKRESKKQDKREELAAKERKEARGEERKEAEREERRVEELEKEEREARRKERKGN